MIGGSKIKNEHKILFRGVDKNGKTNDIKIYKIIHRAIYMLTIDSIYDKC